MELDSRDLNLLVMFCTKNDINATSTHEMITNAFGHNVIGIRRVQKIAKEIKEGKRETVERNEGSGRPRSEKRNSIDVDEIKDEIRNNNDSISLRYLAEEYGTSVCMMSNIIKHDIGLISTATKFVPHSLNSEQKINRVNSCKTIVEVLAKRTTFSHLVIIDEKQFFDRPVGNHATRKRWIEPSGDAPKFVRRSQMDKKHFGLVAITFTGLCHVKVLNRGDTVDSNVYVEFLNEMMLQFDSYQHRSVGKAIPPGSMILMHDNARPHCSNLTKSFLSTKSIQTLYQPPYSPDVNLLDRWFFPLCEMRRTKRYFSTPQEVHDYILECSASMTSDIMKHEYEKLSFHCKNVILHDGDYL